MKKGEIVLIPFPFTDLSGLKNRPALVLINSEVDITVAFISSQLKSEADYDLLLLPSEINGLKKKSILKISKLATLEKNLILGKLGNLDEIEMKKVDRKLIEIFKLNTQ